ncbi:unnamed protein product [Aphanomyces euteiches]|uniref:Uncharacterized protein n=1 Tax=Aphanomyces euteiches TaxID=100861 RepID=A0A6G0W943_9STRA|nr:hypothetical protein Ae201684_017481 [Aphanomyces euteiches]KAH9141478.1 hypothetical protein AeRB84_014350 [Aphanomyces euteiches]
MGASASIVSKQQQLLARKYRLHDKAKLVHERLHALEGQCQVWLATAHRQSKLTRRQVRILVVELQKQTHAFQELAHEKLQPILDALQPYVDKYEPIVEKYVVWTVHQTKVVLDKVDAAVTTATLQALYQARRQMVSQLSTATIASYFHIHIPNVVAVKIAKRAFSIQNCGPDLRHHEVEWTCCLTDAKLISKLFQLQWVPWSPTSSIAVKLTETFMLDVEYYALNEFAIKYVAHLHLRCGPKWIALDTRQSNHSTAPQWLQRIDYKEREKRSTLFHDLIAEAYNQMRRADLAKRSADEKAIAEAAANAPPPMKLTVLTPEMIKRTLAALADKITLEERFVFYTLGEYETWRMEQEDVHLNGDLTIGELYQLFEMEKHDDRLREYAARLVEIQERIEMEHEDVNRNDTNEEQERKRMQMFDLNVDSDSDNSDDDDG